MNCNVLVKNRSLLQMNKAEHLINSNLPQLSKTASSASVLQLMDEWRVTELPLVEDGIYMGLLSETALLDVELVEAELGNQVLDLKDVRVLPNAHVLDVLEIASKAVVSVVPVVSEKGEYLGAITMENLIHRLSFMLGANQEGGIIVLEISERDHSIQQVARIIEENGAKILSLSVSPTGAQMLELHVKVSVPDLNPILQSLSRFGYTVSDQFQDEDFNNELKDRYDELMRYLNI